MVIWKDFLKVNKDIYTNPKVKTNITSYGTLENWETKGLETCENQ